MLKMKNELYYYDIYPKVLPVNKEVMITVKALSQHTYFDRHIKYEVQIVPINAGVESKGNPPTTSVQLKENGTALTFNCQFNSEQEYHIRICAQTPENISNIVVTLPVYVLEDDLLKRCPLIGDFHAHSCLSDGCESPEFVAARYRQEGFDFIAITDHCLYEPSVQAIKAYEKLDLDYKLYPGEEIHSPENNVHLVNFGADLSVNKYCLEKSDVGSWRDTIGKPEWYEEVYSLQETFKDLPEGIDPFTHASCLLAIQKVHEGNGMCILAHPHWLWNVRNIPDVFTKYYFEHGLVDAMELLGGQTCYENMTQIAFYHELRSKGIKVPIVGSSDSHGTVNARYGDPTATYSMFTEEKTMVFAKDNTRDDIISAVKDLYSVAIEQYIGQDFHIHGNYRLVQYALFLYLNYFPLHNELCYEEGRVMRIYINGSKEAEERLRALKGQTIRLYKKYFYQR